MSGSADGTVKIWNINNAKIIKSVDIYLEN